MNFPYGQILKQAFGILRTHKFLWILGLFLVWGYLPNLLYINRESLNWSFDMDHAPWLAVIAVLAILLIWLYFRARAAVIDAVKTITAKDYPSLGQSWRHGRKFYGRILRVSLWIQLTIFTIAILMSAPVVYLLSLNWESRGLVWGLVGLAILLPVWFIATLVNIAAQIFIGLYDMPLKAALVAAFDLALRYWQTLLLFGLCLFGLTLLAALISLIPAGLISLPFVILSHLAYHKGSSLHFDFRILTLISSSIVFFLVQSLMAVYHETSWILAIMELVRTQKIEDEELASAPEVAQ